MCGVYQSRTETSTFEKTSDCDLCGNKMARYLNHSQFKTTSKMTYFFVSTLLAVMASDFAYTDGTCLSIINLSIQNLMPNLILLIIRVVLVVKSLHST